ncbi:MAG: chaperone modulator CbpM [Paracoccaceae bacterium]
MTRHFSQAQIFTVLPRLTETRLLEFVEAEVVVPMHSDSGPLFSDVDLARLELLCDLADDFALEGDALGVVMQLIDQLHSARHRLSLLAEAISAEPLEVRQRLGARLMAKRD